MSLVHALRQRQIEVLELGSSSLSASEAKVIACFIPIAAAAKDTMAGKASAFRR